MRACFFSTAPLEQINREQYSLSDIRILREIGFEVVVANSFRDIPWDCDLYFSWWASGSVLPMIVAKLVRRPNIVVVGGNEAMLYRDSVSGAPQGYLDSPFYKRIATRMTLRFSTVVTVVSNFMVADVSQLAMRKVVVVPNCVDTEQFAPAEAISRKYITTCFRIDEGPMRIKRGEIFVQAAARVLQVRPQELFVIIGYKGDSYRRLRALIDSLGVQDSFIFTGAIENIQVQDWLAESKCYVQISDTETFGVTVAEAMSAGIPVVVSRRGALPELVGDAGLYVDHNSIESVANGLLELLNIAEERRRGLGNRLRASILQSYSFDVRKRSIRALTQSLVGSAP